MEAVRGGYPRLWKLTGKELRERPAARSAVIDEQEIFAKHVSAILRRFTPRQQAQARLQIEQVLVDIEFPEESATPAYFTGRYSKFN